MQSIEMGKIFVEYFVGKLPICFRCSSQLDPNTILYGEHLVTVTLEQYEYGKTIQVFKLCKV